MAGSKDAVFDSAKTIARSGKLVEQADIRLLPAAGHALVNVAATLMPFLVEAAAGPACLPSRPVMPPISGSLLRPLGPSPSPA